MSSSGITAWEKYFKDSDVSTIVKKEGSLLSQSNYSPILNLKKGNNIKVLKQDSYISYSRGSSRYVRVIFGDRIGLFPFSNVAKPLVKNPDREIVPRLNILAEDFISEGLNETVNLATGLEPVKVFSDVNQLKKGVINAFSTKARNYPLIQEQFQKYFDSGDFTKIDLTDISDTHKNELGTYFGEILIGILAISGQTSSLQPNIFTGKRIKDFLIPTDPSFMGVDSFVRTHDGKLFPISSKYGAGAKASFFGNLLPKGLKLYNNIQSSSSVFSKIVKSARDINITAQTLESKRGSKEVLYEYGIRNILGLNLGKIQKTYQVFTKLKNKTYDNETKIVLNAIENNNFKLFLREPQTKLKILSQLPDSVTSFFSRTIANELNQDLKSMNQMREILAGKNFYQANLNITKWKKGEVSIRLINTGEVILKIIGSKAAINDLDAKQGLINYELQYPR